MQTEIRSHRLGAFVYGFMSGLGLILIMWGLASVVALPSSSSSTYVGITLFGVLLFATGSCREAYLRGSLSTPRSIREKNSTTRTRFAPSSKSTRQPQRGATTRTIHSENTDLNGVTAEQIREYPAGTQTHGTVVYEREQQTQT